MFEIVYTRNKTIMVQKILEDGNCVHWVTKYTENTINKKTKSLQEKLEEKLKNVLNKTSYGSSEIA